MPGRGPWLLLGVAHLHESMQRLRLPGHIHERDRHRVGVGVLVGTLVLVRVFKACSRTA
jgi:hypothetical protein